MTEQQLKKAEYPEGQLTPDPYTILVRPLARLFEVYISQAFGHNTDQYVKLFDMIRSASPNDIIRININSPGGSLVTGLQLLNSMRESEAHIITVLDGEAFSLAPLILLAGDEIVVNDHSALMFHNYSWGNVGKGNETRERQMASDRQYKSMLKAYASPFLSDDEIDRVIRGEDLYYTTDEIRERLDLVREYHEREKEAMIEEINAKQAEEARIREKAKEVLEQERAEAEAKPARRRRTTKKTTKKE